MAETAQCQDGAAWWATEQPVPARPDPTVAQIHALALQVRSKQRVRDLAEVFTHQREVDAILDLMPDAFTDPASKFLEPAAGSGNFLVEILRRKLASISKLHTDCREEYEYQLLIAASSVYGIDISPDNVTVAQERMLNVLLEHVHHDTAAVTPSAGFLSAAALVLASNIVCGDTLSDQETLELCDWQPQPGHTFSRVWSHPLVPPADRGLFWAKRYEDTVPVHYSELADRTAPSGSTRQ